MTIRAAAEVEPEPEKVPQRVPAKATDLTLDRFSEWIPEDDLLAIWEVREPPEGGRPS